MRRERDKQTEIDRVKERERRNAATGILRSSRTRLIRCTARERIITGISQSQIRSSSPCEQERIPFEVSAGDWHSDLMRQGTENTRGRCRPPYKSSIFHADLAPDECPSRRYFYLLEQRPPGGNSTWLEIHVRKCIGNFH